MLWDALKVAVAAWAVILLDPWLEETFPTVGDPIRFLVSAIVAALILELLVQFVFGWPTIKIAWRVKDEEAPISELAARIRPGNRESQVFSLKVSVPSGGLIGHHVLRRCFRSGAQLSIRVERASVVPTCEASFKTAGVPTVAPDDATNGFIVDLGQVPRRPGPWHWADVRWRDESTPMDDEFNVEYVFNHVKPLSQFLLNLFIRRSTNVRKFRVIGP
ncbi:hypothetical protein [Compostimonas suwonensis]|uniref:hypothetical protein n=1 Tax=Compostimonas suwonensis TaxID=1048394 RepID=UPI000C23B19E|nr:hypothetical protein [Compostimonas suwonensis]